MCHAKSLFKRHSDKFEFLCEPRLPALLTLQWVCLLCGLVTRLENTEDALQIAKQGTHAGDFHIPHTHRMSEEFARLPLENRYSHTLSSLRIRNKSGLILKWLDSEVARAPAKCSLLILPFIFSRDNQLPEMCHFKQSPTSYVDKT